MAQTPGGSGLPPHPPLACTQIFGSVVGLGGSKTPAPAEEGTGEYGVEKEV